MSPPAQIAQLIARFTVLYPNTEWGFAHVVLSDFNFEDVFIDSALDRFKAIEKPTKDDKTAAIILNLLKFIPEDQRTFDDGEGYCDS